MIAAIAAAADVGQATVYPAFAKQARGARGRVRYQSWLTRSLVAVAAPAG